MRTYFPISFWGSQFIHSVGRGIITKKYRTDNWKALEEDGWVLAESPSNHRAIEQTPLLKALGSLCGLCVFLSLCPFPVILSLPLPHTWSQTDSPRYHSVCWAILVCSACWVFISFVWWEISKALFTGWPSFTVFLSLYCYHKFVWWTVPALNS